MDPVRGSFGLDTSYEIDGGTVVGNWGKREVPPTCERSFEKMLKSRRFTENLRMGPD